MNSGEDGAPIRTTSGSRARDHLANERTWLAWLRSALNLIILGLALAKFAPEQGAQGVAAGILLIIVGASGVVFGTLRYRTVNDELEHGYYLTGSRGRTPILAAGVLLLSLLVALLLLL